MSCRAQTARPPAPFHQNQADRQVCFPVGCARLLQVFQRVASEAETAVGNPGRVHQGMAPPCHAAGKLMWRSPWKVDTEVDETVHGRMIFARQQPVNCLMWLRNCRGEARGELEQASLMLLGKTSCR